MSSPANDARNLATVAADRMPPVGESLQQGVEGAGRPEPPTHVTSQTGEKVAIAQISRLVIGEGDLSPQIEHDGAHYDVRACTEAIEKGGDCPTVELRRNLTLMDAQNYCAAFTLPGIDFIWSNNGMSYFNPRHANRESGLFQPNFSVE